MEKLSNLKIEDYEEVKLENLGVEKMNKKIKTFGWVTKSHALKNVSFFNLTSAFKTVKCVINENQSFLFSTSLEIYGIIKENKSKDSFLFEIEVENFKIYNKIVPPPFPVNKHTEKEGLLDNGHLTLRLKERSLFLQVRSALLGCFRDFYREKDFTEITPPTLVQTQVEGGATLFALDYYGEDA